MSMHKLIMSTPPGCEVDHINHDGLDNRKANLRFVTRKQNAANARKHRDATSKYRGISLYRERQKWLSEIRVDNKLIFLGIFFDELEAAKTYDIAARKYFGEYAFLNFPDEAQSNKSCAEEK
jgi:hypothetical protein